MFLGINRDPWRTSQRDAAQLIDGQIPESIGKLIDTITFLKVKANHFQVETLAHVQREAASDFGKRFIEMVRSVYRCNDQRAALKRQINASTGSRLVEQKSYSDY